MGINLKKGGSFNLTKNHSGLKKILIGLGWETNDKNIDLDASVFILGTNGKLITDEYFVFYNNLKSPDGAVRHFGDNRKGEDEEEDAEIIVANLEVINPKVREIVVAVSIHDALEKNHFFGLLKNAYIRLFDVEKKEELVKYDLDESHFNENTVIFGTLTKIENDWIFNTNSTGNTRGLQSLVDIYA